MQKLKHFPSIITEQYSATGKLEGSRTSVNCS